MAITFVKPTNPAVSPEHVEVPSTPQGTGHSPVLPLKVSGEMPLALKNKLAKKHGMNVNAVVTTGGTKVQQAMAEKATPEMMDAELEDAGVPLTDELPGHGEPKEGHKRFRAPAEAVEYRRKQVLRLLLRAVPRQTIAEHLGIPLPTIENDVREINKAMRNEIQHFDFVSYMGYSLAFYEEVRTLALRTATDGGTKEKKGPSDGTKMAALRTALEAERAKHEFLTRVGVFKIVAPTDPFSSIQTGRHGSYSDENDMDKFMQLIAHASGQKQSSKQGNVVDVDAVEKQTQANLSARSS